MMTNITINMRGFHKRVADDYCSQGVVVENFSKWLKLSPVTIVISNLKIEHAHQYMTTDNSC